MAQLAQSFTLFTDGGSRGNPGPAAAGIILTDPAGKPLYSAGLFLGRATSNVAEYRAVIAGLEQAFRLGAKHLAIRSDSELLVRQLNGEYRVKSELLRPLHGRARELMRGFDHVTIQHVPREENAEADRLVNRALDARANIIPAGGASPAKAAPPGALWDAHPPAPAPADQPSGPPERFSAECNADGFDLCPAVVSSGGVWEFNGATPAGLCVHAAAGILSAIQSARAGASVLPARCARAGCKAAFTVRVRPAPPR